MQGIGFQGHFVVGATPSQSQLEAVFRRFLTEVPGIQELAITELDIRHPPGTVFPANASVQAQQAEDYMSVVGACLAVPQCVGIVVWQFTDKYSWVPSTFSGAGEACLYDENFGKKPAWTSVSAQLAAAATGTASDAGSQVLLSNVSSAPTGVGTARPTGLYPSAPNATLPTGSPVQVAGGGRVIGKTVTSPLAVALLGVVISLFEII